MQEEGPRLLCGWQADEVSDAEPSNRKIDTLTFYGPAGRALAIIAGYNHTWRVEVAPPAERRVPDFERIIELHGSTLADAKLEAEILLTRFHNITEFATVTDAPV